MLWCKPGLAEGAYQLGKLRRCEQSPGRYGQCSQVQHGTVNSTQAACDRQHPQRFLARLEIQVPLRVEANEFVRADNLDFGWHSSNLLLHRVHAPPVALRHRWEWIHH